MIDSPWQSFASVADEQEPEQPMLWCGTGLRANFSHLLVALVADCFLQSGMGVLFLGDERKELVAVIEFASAATAQLVPSKSLRSGGRCASSPCIRALERVSEPALGRHPTSTSRLYHPFRKLRTLRTRAGTVV